MSSSSVIKSSSDKPGWSDLHVAVWNRNVAEVRRLLIAGADVNAKTGDTVAHTALHLAVIDSSLEIVRLLIDSGAAIDVQDHNGNTPIKCACAYGHVAIVELLAFKGADIELSDRHGTSPIITSARLNQLELVEFLYCFGTDSAAETESNRRAALSGAIHNGKRDVTRALLRLNVFCDPHDVETCNRSANFKLIVEKRLKKSVKNIINTFKKSIIHIYFRNQNDEKVGSKL